MEPTPDDSFRGEERAAIRRQHTILTVQGQQHHGLWPDGDTRCRDADMVLHERPLAPLTTKRNARAGAAHKVQGHAVPALDRLSSLKIISAAQRQEVADSQLTPAVQSLTAEPSQLPLMASQPGSDRTGNQSV